jgi:hypothetical protein
MLFSTQAVAAADLPGAYALGRSTPFQVFVLAGDSSLR